MVWNRQPQRSANGLTLKVSAVGPDSDAEGFREGLKRLADEWYDLRGRERRLRKNFTLVMLDMLRLSRATGVWPERDVIKYIRSAIASDGLITRFAPQFDIGEYLERIYAAHPFYFVPKDESNCRCKGECVCGDEPVVARQKDAFVKFVQTVRYPDNG